MEQARMYVSMEIKPLLKKLQQDYVAGVLSYDDIYTMAYGMACHKEENENEEKVSPHTPLLKEEKEKEESFNNNNNNNPRASFDFVEPSVEEVSEYLKQRGYEMISAERFVNYYDATGWTIGNKKIVRWQSALEGWINKVNDFELKTKNNDTTKKRPAADTHATTAAEPREVQMERLLAAQYAGNEKVAWLAKEINAVAEAVGVPLDVYGIRQMADDAQLFSIFDFYRDWDRDRWREAMQYVKQHAPKEWGKDTMQEVVFEYYKRPIPLTPSSREGG